MKENSFSKSEEELLIYISEAGLVRFSAFQKEKKKQSRGLALSTFLSLSKSSNLDKANYFIQVLFIKHETINHSIKETVNYIRAA